MKVINILIADDHKMMRHGIVSILKEESFIGNIHEAANAKETISQCDKFPDIDIIFLDISMPDGSGIEICEIVKRKYPDIQIIALSMLKEEETIRKMIKAGASAYILKDSGKKELLNSIDSVLQGKPYYSEEVTFEVLKGFSSEERRQSKLVEANLTEREIEILQLIADEYTNQQIADMLFISKRTVDTHRTNLLQKTNSKNTAGLVRYALKNNLI